MKNLLNLAYSNLDLFSTYMRIKSRERKEYEDLPNFGNCNSPPDPGCTSCRSWSCDILGCTISWLSKDLLHSRGSAIKVLKNTITFTSDFFNEMTYCHPILVASFSLSIKNHFFKKTKQIFITQVGNYKKHK